MKPDFVNGLLGGEDFAGIGIDGEAGILGELASPPGCQRRSEDASADRSKNASRRAAGLKSAFQFDW